MGGGGRGIERYRADKRRNGERRVKRCLANFVPFSGCSQPDRILSAHLCTAVGRVKRLWGERRETGLHPVSCVLLIALSDFSPSYFIYFCFCRGKGATRFWFSCRFLRTTREPDLCVFSCHSGASGPVRDRYESVGHHCRVNMPRKIKNISNIYLIYYSVLFLSEESHTVMTDFFFYKAKSKTFRRET